MAQATIQPTATKREPSKELLRPEPLLSFEGISPFGVTFGRWFDEFFNRRLPFETERFISPAIDIAEDENSMMVSVELPGMKKEDVTIEFENGVLSIKGEKRIESEKKGKSWHRIERRYGAFSRSMTLPPSVSTEGAQAEFKDGVLEISLPKKEEAKPKLLKVK